jgi:hypothetical protein
VLPPNFVDRTAEKIGTVIGIVVPRRGACRPRAGGSIR